MVIRSCIWFDRQGERTRSWRFWGIHNLLIMQFQLSHYALTLTLRQQRVMMGNCPVSAKYEVFGTSLSSVLSSSALHFVISSVLRQEIVIYHSVAPHQSVEDSILRWTQILLWEFILFGKLGFFRLVVVSSPSVTLLLLLKLLSADKKLFALPDALNPSSNHVQVTCKD